MRSPSSKLTSTSSAMGNGSCRAPVRTGCRIFPDREGDGTARRDWVAARWPLGSADSTPSGNNLCGHNATRCTVDTRRGDSETAHEDDVKTHQWRNVHVTIIISCYRHSGPEFGVAPKPTLPGIQFHALQHQNRTQHVSAPCGSVQADDRAAHTPNFQSRSGL